MILRLQLKDKKGQVVYKGYKVKRTAFSHFIVARFLQFKPFSAKLTIEYRKHWTNSGIYLSLKELKSAFQAFTAKSLTDYVKK